MNFKDTINKYRYYDTHSHINSDPLLSQSDQIINECKNQESCFISRTSRFKKWLFKEEK